MNESVNIHYAKTHFSALLKRVQEGAVITISSAGSPVAKLVPVERGGPRVPSGFAFRTTRKFLEPMSARELDSWER